MRGSFNYEAYSFEEFEQDRLFWNEAVPKIETGKIDTLVVSGGDQVFRSSSAEVRIPVTNAFRRHVACLITSSGEVSGGTGGSIADNSITNADINSSAAIGTSKLSGAVTN